MYDELLTGLGDGMAAGLENGLGDRENDTVFRRSFSALLLAECVARDNQQRLLPDNRILRWGDRIAAWYVRELDLRGWVPGKGWAHAIAHGADAIGVLARSATFDVPELTVLLDVLADRLLLPTEQLFVSGEPDRMAAATLQVLHRNLVPLAVLEPWVGRSGEHRHRLGRQRHLPDQPQRAGVPAGAAPAAGPRAAPTRRTLRPAAGPGRRPARHQPALLDR